MKWIITPCRNFISYFKPSWEGDDGKLSYRRASQFVFVTCFVKIVWSGIQNIYQVYALITVALTFLLLAAVIHFDQLQSCVKTIVSLKGKLTDFLKDQTSE